MFATLALATLFTAAVPSDCGRSAPRELVLPAPDSSGAPLNAQLIFAGRPSRGPELHLAATGARVAIDVTAVDFTTGGSFLRIRPTSRLAANQRYELRWFDEGALEERAAAFTTGDAEDTEAPAAPAVMATSAPTSAGLCIAAGLEVYLAANDGVLWIAERESDGVPIAFTDSGTLSVDGEAGAQVAARVVAIDAAGNRSPATAVSGQALEAAYAQGGEGCGGIPFGCRCAGRSSAPASALASLLLLLGWITSRRLTR